jgi:hypothetical protein
MPLARQGRRSRRMEESGPVRHGGQGRHHRGCVLCNQTFIIINRDSLRRFPPPPPLRVEKPMIDPSAPPVGRVIYRGILRMFGIFIQKGSDLETGISLKNGSLIADSL